MIDRQKVGHANLIASKLRTAMTGRRLRWLGVLALVFGAFELRAEQTTVAVAANFRVVFETLAETFEAATGHRVAIVSGSTGQLYAQIKNGAPFDLFLAADQERPARLVGDGLGLAESIQTYAEGRLVLWSADQRLIGPDALDRLAETDFAWFAIADPELAPYGRAAREVLERIGAWDSVQSRLVSGQNVAQTFAWIETRNADLGLVALSQAVTFTGPASYLLVPATLHGPIRQDAVLLARAKDNAAARSLLEYLGGSEAAEIIERAGYAAGSSN